MRLYYASFGRTLKNLRGDCLNRKYLINNIIIVTYLHNLFFTFDRYRYQQYSNHDKYKV